MAAELGHLQLAHDYFAEAALMDLHDLRHNTRDGLHIASLAGAWIVPVCGFGGMRDHNGHLTFNPHLPARLTRLSFWLLFRGRRLKVDVTDTHATYTLLDGTPLEIRHHGNPVTISRDGTGHSRTRPSLPRLRRPSHPAPTPQPLPRGSPVPACQGRVTGREESGRSRKPRRSHHPGLACEQRPRQASDLSRFAMARSTPRNRVDAFAPSGPRRGPEATAPSLRAAARNRKGQSEEYPMHYIADDLEMDAWVKAGLARLERYLACWRLFTQLYPADAP
jgi:hypothetical protein